MEGLINRLLELLRMEGGKTPPSCELLSFDLFLHETADELRPRAAAKGIEIHVEKTNGLPVLSLDKVQMDRVLINLMDNALKYSPSGTKGTLRAWKEEIWVMIEIRDGEVGISPEDVPHILDYFYRSRKTADYAGSTGLGLASARGIVEAHGGRIWGESKKGKGNSFFIRLPLEHRPGVSAPGSF